MSAYRPYPKYKPSGVEWLGDVPERWEVKQARHLGSFSGSGIDKKLVEGELPVKMFNYLDVYKSVDKQLVYRPDLMDTTAPAEKVRDHSVRQGDLLFTPSSETADDVGHAARVMEVPAGVVYSYHVLRFRQTKVSDSAFLTYFFNSKPLRSYFSSICTGTTRMVLSRDDFNCAPIALPPHPEQIQIAAFLDRECGKLDALQAKQERLIELLKEKRQALISHAVTKGLNPTAKLKTSAIEWLGEVPEHWRVTRLRFVIRELESGVSVNSIDTPADPDQFGVLKTSCVYTREFRPDENKAVVIDEMDRVRCPVKKTCLIISRMNTPELVGAAGFVDRDYPTLFLPDRLWQTIFYQPSEEIARFLSFVMSLKGFRDEIGMISTGTSSSMKNIAKEDLLGLTIPLPPLAEQRAIVAHLDEKCGKIDQLKAKAERGIELLKERRSALISAAVTGKIDVRGA